MAQREAKIPPADVDVLRRVAGEVAEIGSRPVQGATAELWKKLNVLQPVRPLVWINEVCWGELEDEEEMRLSCTDPWARWQERYLRAVLYQWRHFRGDMTVEPALECPLAIRDTGYGVEEQATLPNHEFGSRDYIPVITSEADVEKIQIPRVTVDREASEAALRRMREVYGESIPIVQRGVSSFWMAPWDVLVRWYGITEMFEDMYERPALVHAAIARMCEAMDARLTQLEDQSAVSLNNRGVRAGAGGLGWTDELPRKDFDGERVRLIDCWGNSTPQIFAGVSPEMHWEFGLQYEMRFLKRFGLNCYGCCEPLHKKVDILRKIPRLRRISMSPRADWAEGAEALGTEFVFSMKPNPAVLATDVWNPQQARKDLVEGLEQARGCRIEIILKDISTIRREPRRLWDWADIATDVAEQFAP